MWRTVDEPAFHASYALDRYRISNEQSFYGFGVSSSWFLFFHILFFFSRKQRQVESSSK
jgi:uncharacterized membrane protein